MKNIRKYIPAAGLSVLSVLCIILVISVHLRPGRERYAYAPYSFWILQPEELTEEAIPDHAGVQRSYTFTIPEGSASNIGARILFYMRHTEVSLNIEGTDLVYDSSETDDHHIGHTPGNYWVSVPVRINYAGAKLHITLTPLYKSVSREAPVFYLIGHEQLLNMIILPQDARILTLGLIALVAGFFLCLLAFVLPLRSDDKQHILLLGALAICAACWKMADLPSVTLALDSYGCSKEIWYCGAVMYLLMLVLSLRFLLSMREDSEEKLGQAFYRIALYSAIIIVVLQLMDLLELHDVLIWYGVGLAILHFLALFSHKPSQKELLWLLPFFLTMGIDLFYYRSTGSISNAPFFLGWTVFNLFVRGFGFISSALKREQMLRKREEELREAKVQSMISQIRPHFIYNTLSSIYLLCKDDPQKAMEVIGDFTSYLQANFTAITAKDPIEFNEELRHTKSYIAVESMMHGDKLSVEYDTPYTAFLLPPLTLQPIVENSIIYGVGRSGKAEKIEIRTYREKNGTYLTVEDDGMGYKLEDSGSSAAEAGMESQKNGKADHVGLQNVRERLEMLCGGTLDIAARPGGGTVVTIFIPDHS